MKSSGLNSKYDYTSCNTWNIFKITCSYALFLTFFRRSTVEKPRILDVLAVVVVQYCWGLVRPVRDIKRKVIGILQRIFNRLSG